MHRILSSARRVATGLIWGALVLTVAMVGYRFLRADVAADVYRARLEKLADRYDTLLAAYEQAVRRTAVSELVVQGGRLSVRVRTAEGVLREIPTPFDPHAEIYVDYVVLGGRLWIRRVFDARTPPSEGVVIDPRIAHVDWSGELAGVGKAVYRRLDEGRWVITVTGNGSLGLARAETDDPAPLAPPPIIRTEELIPPEAPPPGVPGVLEVWRRLIGID